MPNLGIWEWVIILTIVIILFGVGKLPQIGGALGQSIREFRSSAKEVRDVLDEAGEGLKGVEREIKNAAKDASL